MNNNQINNKNKVLLILAGFISIIGFEILINNFNNFRFYYKYFAIGVCLLFILDCIFELYLLNKFRSTKSTNYIIPEILPERLKLKLEAFKEISSDDSNFYNWKSLLYKSIIIVMILIIILYIFM